MFFISWKNNVWCLSYVISKFTISGLSLKVLNLAYPSELMWVADIKS